jgi:hypothetical protein
MRQQTHSTGHQSQRCHKHRQLLFAHPDLPVLLLRNHLLNIRPKEFANGKQIDAALSSGRIPTFGPIIT